MMILMVVAVPGLPANCGVMVNVAPEVACERCILNLFVAGTSVTPAGRGDDNWWV